MPRGLHALGIRRSGDEQALAKFLADLPRDPGQSYFESIERVPPGHLLRLTATGQTRERYWSPRPETLRLALGIEGSALAGGVSVVGGGWAADLLAAGAVLTWAGAIVGDSTAKLTKGAAGTLVLTRDMSNADATYAGTITNSSK